MWNTLLGGRGVVEQIFRILGSVYFLVIRILPSISIVCEVSDYFGFFFCTSFQKREGDCFFFGRQMKDASYTKFAICKKKTKYFPKVMIKFV